MSSINEIGIVEHCVSFLGLLAKPLHGASKHRRKIATVSRTGRSAILRSISQWHSSSWNFPPTVHRHSARSSQTNDARLLSSFSRCQSESLEVKFLHQNRGPTDAESCRLLSVSPSAKNSWRPSYVVESTVPYTFDDFLTRYNVAKLGHGVLYTTTDAHLQAQCPLTNALQTHCRVEKHGERNYEMTERFFVAGYTFNQVQLRPESLNRQLHETISRDKVKI